MMKNIMFFSKRQLKRLYQVVKVNATPRKIALGIAIAIFWNFLPVLGFGSVLTFVAAKIFKASEMVAVAFHLGTGFLIPVFYALNIATGRFLLGGREFDFLSPVISALNSLGQLLSEIISAGAAQILVSISYDFLIGSIFNAALAFVSAYVITKVVFRFVRPNVYSNSNF